MTKDEIKAEILKLETEFAQMVVKSHFIEGAKAAFNSVLSILETREKAVIAEVKEEIKHDDSNTVG